MIRIFTRFGLRLAVLVGVCLATTATAELPTPVLQSVFPAGGQAGTSVTVTVTGSALDGLRDFRTTVPGLTVKKAMEANRFTLTIPAGTPAGIYDLRTVGLHGVSSPRAFFVSSRTEHIETEPNDAPDSAQQIVLDSVVNARLDKPGDIDCFRFTAKAGQRVVVECWARRIDSQLRGVLEIFDTSGTRLAVNRGHAGIDPLIDFVAPTDGNYVVKVFDLSYLGGAAHFYRLDVDTKPRPEFALPCVVPQGKTTRVKVFGRNLVPTNDYIEVDITPPGLDRHTLIPLPLRPAQLGVEALAYHHPGGHLPVMIGVTDVPVMSAASTNHDAEHAQDVDVPCEVSGQLAEGDERHWYAVRVRRGDVLWLETFGERIGAPVDLDVAVLDATGKRELAKLGDCVENIGGYRLPTSHTDAAGRWVAPVDGRFLMMVRNLIGGLERDPRRVYRLSVRREEPDFALAVMSRRSDHPAALNLPSGGREMMEVLALRRRGMTGPIRVTADKLPPGIECPDVWIGPDQDRAALVLTAARQTPPLAGTLNLIGHADIGGTYMTRPVRGGTMIWPAQPMPSGRLTQDIAFGVTAEANTVLTATADEAIIDQDSVLDVAVDVEQRAAGAGAAMQLTGIGLPRLATNALATIPAGKTKGWISFYFPASLPPGPYTFAVQGTTEGKMSVTLVSNPITVYVRPAHMSLEIDPRTPRKIARGKIIQLRFTAERKNGFIGKIHAELDAPGGVVGLRARGVTLVGQTDSGSLQVIATETAPLGRHLFLRLEAVGTVEDQPVYRASRFVELEITE